MKETAAPENAPATRRLRIKEAAEAMGVSVRAVYNRIERFGWQKEEDPQNRVWVFIPEDYLAACRQALAEEAASDHGQPVPPPISAEPSAHASGSSPGPTTEPSTLANPFEEIRRAYDAVLHEKDLRIKLLEEQLGALKEDKQVLNRELENRNFQIQRYREQSKESRQRPWWRFWGA